MPPISITTNTKNTMTKYCAKKEKNRKLIICLQTHSSVTSWLLTNKMRHLTSLAAPKQPKNETRHTIADVTMSTYTVPEKRFVPSNSFIKLRSTSVHMPRPNRTAPPIWNWTTKVNQKLKYAPFNWWLMRSLTNMTKLAINKLYLAQRPQPFTSPPIPILVCISKKNRKKRLKLAKCDISDQRAAICDRSGVRNRPTTIVCTLYLANKN